MKITFFKNATHFYPRISYCFDDNAEVIKYKYKSKKFSNALSVILCLPFLAYLIYAELTDNARFNIFLIEICIFVVILPIHEFCHALFCWISKRKVDMICFFPYKFTLNLNLPIAYVKPSFGAFNKYQQILFNIFPLIILSIIPAMLVPAFPSIKQWLIFLSIENLALSSLDIYATINLIFIPNGSVCFSDFILLPQNKDIPIVIHKIFVTNEANMIYHEQYSYLNMLLTKEHIAVDTDKTIAIKAEFAKQFSL